MSQAYVLICSKTGKDDSIISKLRQIDTVQSAYGTFGPYDVITTLESENEQKTQNDILSKIRKIPQIRSTLTLMVDSNEIEKLDSTEKEILEKHMSQAYVLMTYQKPKDKQVLNGLQNIAEVTESDHLVGAFEILCKISAPTYNDISEIVSKKIRKIQGIESTVTLNVIEKQGFSK